MRLTLSEQGEPLQAARVPQQQQQQLAAATTTINSDG